MKYGIIGSSLLEYDNKTFLQSLIPYLRNHGHKLVDINPEILLSFGFSKINNVKTVLRWDESCDNQDLTNVSTVVFSTKSQQEKVNCERSVVICDGTELISEKELSPGFNSIRQDYEIVFSLFYHESISHEKIKQIYDELKKTINKKCCLIIMSDTPLKISGNDIFFVPCLDLKERRCLYSMSNYHLYLAQNRNCPTEILESLSQGTLILHSGQENVIEICGEYGRTYTDVLKPIPEYPWKLQHIDIEYVAKQYSDLMLSLR